ncbi:MAG: YcxB family protein [Planctomycetota bacterium]
MPDPVQYKLDESTYRRLLWKHYGDYARMRSRWLTGPLNIAIGFALFSIPPIPGFERGMLIFGTFAICTGTYLLISRHYYIYKVIRQWKRLPDSEKQTRMSIGDDTLELDSEIASSKLTGESVVKVQDFGEGFLIYLSRQHFIAVPRDAFADDRVYRDWIAALHALAGPDSEKEGWR